MNMGMKRAALMMLSASLVMTSLAGCSKSSEAAFDADATVLTVNEETVSAGLIKFAVSYSQAQTQEMYEYYFGDNPYSYDYSDGYTIGDMVIESCIESFEEMILARQNMEDYDVSLTEDEEAAISEAAAAFIEANDEETLTAMSATQEIVEEYLSLITIQSKMEVEMCADVDTEVSDEEAAQRRVEYVYVAMETEDETEEETEAEETESEEAASEDAVDETADEADTEAETVAETEEETAAETVADEESETALLSGNAAIKTMSSDETETEAAETEEAESEAADTDAAEDETDTEDASEAESEETETETETETEDPEVVAAMEEACATCQQIIDLLLEDEDLSLEEAAQQIEEDLSSNEITFGADSTSVVENLITATEGVADDTLIEYPVEASSGYYVVRVVNEFDEEATEEEKESIVEDRKDEMISDLYTEWEEDGEISQDDEVLATITFDSNLYLYEEETESEEEAESESEADSEEGTEAESEEAEAESDTEAAEVAEDDTEAESEAETEAAESEDVTEADTADETETE
ncbi:MAG: hypothetical protein LUI13_13460 [Lachnospiraceae bacterium]|nr:hypothetical protein [Lachnospiraceae bacterium]